MCRMTPHSLWHAFIKETTSEKSIRCISSSKQECVSTCQHYIRVHKAAPQAHHDTPQHGTPCVAISAAQHSMCCQMSCKSAFFRMRQPTQNVLTKCIVSTGSRSHCDIRRHHNKANGGWWCSCIAAVCQFPDSHKNQNRSITDRTKQACRQCRRGVSNACCQNCQPHT